MPAIDARGWPGLKSIGEAHAGLFPAYGLHPMFLAGHGVAHLHELHRWIERERPLAIGECGLDFYVDGLDRDAQHAFFDAQLRMARDFELPVILHARRAVDAVIAAIRRVGGLRGVVHSFPGSRQQAETLWNMGFLLGIGGPVTYERAQRLRKLVATMPLDHLLLETDSPDQPDCAHRGRRNEPARLVHVLHAVATLRDESPEEVARATTRNAERLFGLPSARAGDYRFGLSRSSIALATAANAKAPVMCVAAPSPAPQSSLSADSPVACGRTPQTVPSACG